MEEKQQITFRTVTVNRENFLNIINPDTVSEETQGFLSFNTGIYGSKIDNAYPELCIDLYNNGAPAHQNLVNLKANLIVGNNLMSEDKANEQVLNPFIGHRNKTGDNLKQVYAKASKDMALMNACVFQVVFNRDGKIAEIYHVPVQDFRLGKPNKFGQIEYGFISKSWGIIANSKSRRNSNRDFVRIRMFDPSSWKKHPVQLMYLKDYSYGYYAMPAYSAALNWILVGREISDFHLNNIRSNFFLGGMLTQKKGGMTDAQIDANSQAIEQFYKGKSGRKILLSYVEDLVNDKPVYDQFVADEQDKMFEILSQQCFQEIVTAHNAYSILAGVDSKGSDLGGDSNKLNIALTAFNALVCEKMKNIICGGINHVCEINNLPKVIVLTDPLKIAQPIPQPNDLTRDERRDLLYGLPPLGNDVNQVSPDNNIPTE